MPPKSCFKFTLANFHYYSNVYFSGCTCKHQVSTSDIRMSPLGHPEFSFTMWCYRCQTFLNAIPWSRYPLMGVSLSLVDYLTACWRSILNQGMDGIDGDAIDSWLLAKGKTKTTLGWWVWKVRFLTRLSGLTFDYIVFIWWTGFLSYCGVW